jgi:hypothetical protein
MDGFDRYPEPDGGDVFDARDAADSGYLDAETRLEEARYDGITSDEDETDDGGYIPDTPPITAGTVALVGEISDATGLLKDSATTENAASEEDVLATEADIADLHHTIRRAASVGTGEEIPPKLTGSGIRYERPMLEDALPKTARHLLAKVPVGTDAEIISYHEVRLANGEGAGTRGEVTDFALERSTAAEVQFERREFSPYTVRRVNLGYTTERFSGVADTDHSSPAYEVVRHIDASTWNIEGGRALIDEHRDTFIADPELHTARNLVRDEIAGIAEHLTHAMSLEDY